MVWSNRFTNEFLQKTNSEKKPREKSVFFMPLLCTERVGPLPSFQERRYKKNNWTNSQTISFGRNEVVVFFTKDQTKPNQMKWFGLVWSFVKKTTTSFRPFHYCFISDLFRRANCFFSVRPFHSHRFANGRKFIYLKLDQTCWGYSRIIFFPALQYYVTPTLLFSTQADRVIRAFQDQDKSKYPIYYLLQ